MILRKLANLIDFRFHHVCVQSAWTFLPKIWEKLEKIKTDVDRLLLVSKLKKSSILAKYIRKFVFIIKTKVVYLHPFLSFLPFLKFRKQHFMYFGHKHVETGPNCSCELATFLKYHMPLSRWKKSYL